MTVGDPWYGQHRSLSDRMLQVIPSDARTPEELLIEAEEQPAGRHGRRRRFPSRREVAKKRLSALLVESNDGLPRQWPVAPGRSVLKKLPPKDREILLLTYGHELEQRAVGRSRGVSHQAISKRLQVIQKRVEWLTGPGGLFTAIDVHRDFLWRLPPDDVRLLRAFWRTRKVDAVAREVGRHIKHVRTRIKELVDVVLVRFAIEEPERYGRYLTGFQALRAAIAGGCSIFRGM